MLRFRRKQDGFTLIELLVVIAIIAILAAILFPVFSSARTQARKARCASNMKQIALAWLRYCDDWQDRTPPYVAGDLTKPPYGMTILPWVGQSERGEMWWHTGILNQYMKSPFLADCPQPQADLPPPNSPANGLPYFKGKGVYGYNGSYLVWGGRAGIPYNHQTAAVSIVTTSMVQVPSKTICFIDSLDQWATAPLAPSSGGRGWDAVSYADRHNKGWNASFCDAHVKYFTSRPNDRKPVAPVRGIIPGRSAIGANDYFWALDKRRIPLPQ